MSYTGQFPSPGKPDAAASWVRERRPLIAALLLLFLLLVGTATAVAIRFERDGISLYAENLRAIVGVASQQLEESFSEIGKMVRVLSLSQVTREANAEQLIDLLRQTAETLEAHGAVATMVVRDGELSIVRTQSVDAAVERQLTEAARLCLEQPGVLCVDNLRTAQGAQLIVFSMRLAPGSPVADDVAAIAIDWQIISGHVLEQTHLDQWSQTFIIDRDGTFLSWPSVAAQPRLGTSGLGSSCMRCHGEIKRQTVAEHDKWSAYTLEIMDHAFLVVASPVQIGRDRMQIGMVAPASVAVTRLGSFLLWGVLVLFLLLSTIGFVIYRLHRLGTTQVRAIRRANEAVQQLNEELEEKVQARTLQLEDAHSRARALQREHATLDRLAAIGELASVFAHEVRTPLNALSIAQQRLARIARKGDAIPLDVATDILDSQARDVEVINSYVENYLQFTRRARAGANSDVGECRLRDLLQEVAGYIEPEAKRAKVKLDVNAEPADLTAKLDYGKLRHVLVNLALNAVQVQPQGGEVWVRASRENGLLHIEVADRGPGVPDDKVGSIFEPFKSYRDGGTGLGLAIAQRLAKEERATIQYQAREEGGSVFAITWPV